MRLGYSQILPFLLICVFIFANNAVAETLCVAKSGSVKVAAVCKKNERAIEIGVPGPKGEKGDPGATGSQGPAGAPGEGASGVYDAENRRIGTLTQIAFPGAYAIVQLDGESYFVSFLRNEIAEVGELSFTTDDCSGTPYTDRAHTDTDVMVKLPAISGPNRTLYEPDESKPPALSETFKSAIYQGQCILVSNWAPGNLRYPVKPKIDLTTIATPPFSVR